MKSRVATVPSKPEPERELNTAADAASTNKTIRPGEKKQPQLSLTAVAAAAGAVIAFWVVSFPRCVVMHPVGECEWLGFRVTCLPAIDRDGPWNFHLAHWLLAGVLFTIGVANATRVNTQQNYVTTAATAGYALVTSSFAVFRAQFGLSKPLLIGAALHNLFEWVFVATVTHPTLAAKKQFVAKAAAWIFLVVLAVAIVPDIKIATIMEQSVGIMLDFFLVLAYFELAITGPDAEVRSFYLLPFAAAATHLFCTILPLVFANFAVGSTGYFVVVNEAMIYVSPVVTHTIYFVWGQRFDARCNNKGDIDQRFVVDGMKRRMLAAFAIGFIPLVGISSHAGSCQAPTVLTGTTIARVHPGLGDAFVDRITHFNLVETAKDTPGCVDYVLTRSIQNPNEFRFIEKWESAEAVTHWIEHGLPAQLFHADAAMQQLLVGGQLTVQGAYMDVQPRRAVAHGGFAFPLGSPCNKVWNVVGNWSDCSWVVGCTHAHVVNATTRTLHLAAPDGQLARHLTESLTEHFDDDMALTYGYPGYEATVRLAANATSGGCVATYAFRADGGAAQVEAIYKDFLSHRIPVLQQQFSA